MGSRPLIIKALSCVVKFPFCISRKPYGRAGGVRSVRNPTLPKVQKCFEVDDHLGTKLVGSYANSPYFDYHALVGEYDLNYHFC